MNTKHTQKKTVLLALFCLGLLWSDNALVAQQLWPGDINDNGIVNNVDLLFWGIAKGDQGPKRDQTGTEWTAYDSAEDWADDFLTGLNYAQADADGQGKVKNADKNVIIQDNYGAIHGTVTPDVFLTGNPLTDPTLLLVPESPVVRGGEAINFNVYLGNVLHQVDHYFGIAFTINFDPAIVENETNDTPWNPSVASFDLLYDTWLNGSGNKSSKSYIYLHDDAGQLDVVLLRKKLGQNSGHGEIASFTILIEDIMYLEDVTTGFTVDKIKLIDENMVEYPVAGSTAYVTILASGQALRANEQDAETVTMAATERETREVLQPEQLKVKLFPNPSAQWLQIDLQATDRKLIQADIYNQQGLLMLSEAGKNTPQELINIQSLAEGSYYLHLITDAGKSVLQFNKTANF